jgi:IK cytokine
MFAVPTKNNELRKQEIENSKYLGGDMEHTHLVKGLDFALLNKVLISLVIWVLHTDHGSDRSEVK